MKRNTKKSAHENGSTTLEALAAIIILCFILFGMLQIYHWCMTRQFCQYAAFYACKSLALGFKPDLAMRAARVSAMARAEGWIPREGARRHRGRVESWLLLASDAGRGRGSTGASSVSLRWWGGASSGLNRSRPGLDRRRNTQSRSRALFWG